MTRHRVGSIEVTDDDFGNLMLETTHTVGGLLRHNPFNPDVDRVVVERADAIDLVRALLMAIPASTVVDSGLLQELTDLRAHVDAEESVPMTSQDTERVIVLGGERVAVTVSVGGRQVAAFSLATERWHTLQSLHVRASGNILTNSMAGGGIQHERLGEDAIPWRRLGDIAKFVEGDGADPQRIALADAIRQGVTK